MTNPVAAEIGERPAARAIPPRQHQREGVHSERRPGAVVGGKEGPRVGARLIQARSGRARDRVILPGFVGRSGEA